MVGKKTIPVNRLSAWFIKTLDNNNPDEHLVLMLHESVVALWDGIKEMKNLCIRRSIRTEKSNIALQWSSRYKKLEHDYQKLSSAVEDLLTPSNGNSCSDFEFEVRRRNYLDDGTDCPYIKCRYWFENEKYMNCAKLVFAKYEGEAATLEEIGKIENFIGKGQVSRERVRQVEDKAMKVFKKKISLPSLYPGFKKLAELVGKEDAVQSIRKLFEHR